jgi:hypothetical protein
MADVKAEEAAAAAKEREQRLATQRDAALAETRKVKEDMNDLREVGVVVKRGMPLTQQPSN